MLRKLRLSATLFVALFNACVLAPRETPQEQARLDQAGRGFEKPIEERALPALPAQPDWRELLEYAFLSNGELEAAHAEWRAAMERVTRAAGYPNTNTQIGFQYLFSGGQMKAWDRTTLTAGFDPMVNLSFPLKTVAAGRVALDDARVAGERFRAAKFGLQQRILSAYYGYALLAERLRLQSELAEWLELSSAAARARLQVGATQPDLLAAQIAADSAFNDLRAIEAQLPQQRALLNGMIGRRPDAALDAPARLPAARRLPPDDRAILAVVQENNPDLSALAHMATSREHGVEVTRLQIIPDVNPFVGLSGSATQLAGAAIILPTTLPQIRAAIRESRAMLDAAVASLRQARHERAAEAVATLAALRDVERQVQWFDRQILPALELSNRSTHAAYAASSGPLLPLIEGEQLRLEILGQLAELRMSREQRLAELETLAGVDIETLEGRPAVAAAGEGVEHGK